MKKNTVVLHQVLQVCSSSSSESEVEEGEVAMQAPVTIPLPPCSESSRGGRSCVGLSLYNRRLLSKQISMRETKMEAKWEKRRQQIMQRRSMMERSSGEAARAADAAAAAGEGDDAEAGEKKPKSLTDEDLDELRGSIDLGFGFNEEEGAHHLCDTLPALNLYFAVNRQLSDPKLQTTPSSPATTLTPTTTLASTLPLSGIPSPQSPNEQQAHPAGSSESWKICNPGDSPQHVKTRLRHWAQAVACSLRQSC
ncbi:hypothetical protein Cni_G05062 [Canna indica]|uniref:Uncharacterized protein n=1 Tax=Canna indica TaxID=4628 RepID=A0AAQ3Q4K4_9LILI|nr:hypothetical protein Cni_G05062 [Canna indica]